MAFDDFFTDWTMAMLLDQSGWVAGSRFNYDTNFAHRKYGSHQLGGPVAWNALPERFRSRQYGVDYAVLGGLTGSTTLRFSVQGAPKTDVLVIRRH